MAWLTPDLHGSIAAGLGPDAIVGDRRHPLRRLRPDGRGVAHRGIGGHHDWKYQGRLDLSPSTIPLYAAGARDYAPGLGMFTSLDGRGSAQDPYHEPLVRGVARIQAMAASVMPAVGSARRRILAGPALPDRRGRLRSEVTAAIGGLLGLAGSSEVG